MREPHGHVQNPNDEDKLREHWKQEECRGERRHDRNASSVGDLRVVEQEHKEPVGDVVNEWNAVLHKGSSRNNVKPKTGCGWENFLVRSDQKEQRVFVTHAKFWPRGARRSGLDHNGHFDATHNHGMLSLLKLQLQYSEHKQKLRSLRYVHCKALLISCDTKTKRNPKR